MIDATASLHVRSKLETLLKDHEPRVPICAVMLSASAQYAVAAIAPSGYGAGPLDVLRRVGPLGNQPRLAKRLGQCFLDDRRPSMVSASPSPGCSDPTFVASHADVASLSARALNAIAKSLVGEQEVASGFLFSQSPDQQQQHFRFRPDIRWVAGGLGFRLAANAWRDITGWIQAGTRERSAEHETGGLLFGRVRRDARNSVDH